MTIEGHYSAKYDVELAELSDHTLTMARLVEQQLKSAMNALTYGDTIRAMQVEEREQTVNDLEVEIDAMSTELIARRQPIAGDLRFVLMIIKMVNDLERMGDEINRIAIMAKRITEKEGEAPSYFDIEEIGIRVLNMFDKALIAFEQTDDVGALAVMKTDRKVDKKYEKTLKRITTWMMESPMNVPEAVDILWALRSLERVGDRICNLCEHVIFFVKAEDIRHMDIDSIYEQLEY